MSDEGPSNSDATKGKGVGDRDPPPGVSAKVLEELEERLVKRIPSWVTAPAKLEEALASSQRVSVAKG